MGGEHNKRLNGIRICKDLSIERVLETSSLCGGLGWEIKCEQRKISWVFFKKITK